MTETTSLAPYLSPDARDARLKAHAVAAGGEVVSIGSSVEGRPLLAARLPQLNGAVAATAKVLLAANIHGVEYVSAALALGVLERLVGGGDEATRLRERAEVWVAPCLNPDGYARVWHDEGKGPIAVLRPNARGVDLNRNFPLPEGRRRTAWPGAGSRRLGAATYVGQSPLSEPESAAVAAFCAQKRFAAVLSGHSFMGCVIPASVRDRATFRAYRGLCGAIARAQPRYQYRPLSSMSLDTFTGELEDYVHHHLGGWAVCLETFPFSASLRQNLFAERLFWRFNPRDPAPFVANDVPGVIAYFHAALDLGPRAREA